MKDWKEVNGWLFTEEAELLQKYTKLTTFDIIELGVYEGKSSCAIYPVKNTTSHHYAIDTFDGRATTDMRDTFQEFKKNIENSNIIIFKGTTDDFIKQYNGNIGLLFIDADHSYNAVKNDFNNYFLNVLINGFIIFHDAYGENGEEEKTPWPGVTQFCKELLLDDRVQFVEKCRRCAVFKRVK
ncbi:MAG TPA: class I SAM-dependent methyltransferase [Allocoleopsis sp.]